MNSYYTSNTNGCQKICHLWEMVFFNVLLMLIDDIVHRYAQNIL